LFDQEFQDVWGEHYGKQCFAWEFDDCQEFGPKAGPAPGSYQHELGDWCCWRWCYVDKSCPSAELSALADGLFFSYDACPETEPDVEFCPWQRQDGESKGKLADQEDERIGSMGQQNGATGVTVVAATIASGLALVLAIAVGVWCWKKQEQQKFRQLEEKPLPQTLGSPTSNAQTPAAMPQEKALENVL
jgi:hypothetical protein